MFWGAVAEADFLFGPEIRQYIEEVFSRGFRLHQAQEQYNKFSLGTAPPDYNPNEVTQVIESESRWLTEQLSTVGGRLIVAEKFRPYLDISK